GGPRGRRRAARDDRRPLRAGAPADRRRLIPIDSPAARRASSPVMPADLRPSRRPSSDLEPRARASVRALVLALFLALPLALAACGGGGGSETQAPIAEPTPPPGPEPTPGSGECEVEYDGTFAAIQDLVFERHGCTEAACHGSAVSGGLDLRPDAAFASLVEVPSTGSALPRVAPGDDDRSYLYAKLA